MKFIRNLLLVILIGILSSGLVACDDAYTAIVDREGNEITLPAIVRTIGSFGASNTEILTELGLGSKIVVADTYSKGIKGLKDDVTYFDMYAADLEKIIEINPTVMFISGMTKIAGDDIFKPLSDAGIIVMYIPSSKDIQGIKEDIEFIATACGEMDKGRAIVNIMEMGLKEIADKVKDKPKKSVYFELQPSPDLYSFGSGVFLNEMIEIAGGENVFKNMDSWISVSEEAVIAANPEIIFTSVYFAPEPVKEILNRTGWDAVKAVKNSSVYLIDANSSSQPCHNIVKAVKEMAEAINPGLFEKE